MTYIYNLSGGGFAWAASNVTHVARRGLQPGDVEHALTNDPVTVHYAVTDSGEPRWVSVGPASTGRLLAVVWTVRDARVHVVTAYPSARRLQAAYAKAKGGHDGASQTDPPVQD
jgi:uncharacterized DUF497 family protein